MSTSKGKKSLFNPQTGKLNLRPFRPGSIQLDPKKVEKVEQEIADLNRSQQTHFWHCDCSLETKS